MYKKIILIFILILLLVILKKQNRETDLFMGGLIGDIKINDIPVFISAQESQRYQSPSQSKPLDNKYNYDQILNGKSSLSFTNPQDLIYAYFGILKEASNMIDYSGGCGSISDGNGPYKYAYELFTDNKKKNMTLKQFEDSFLGIGHINLLKLYPLKNTDSTSEYFFEIETIEGIKNNGPKKEKTVFAYYYGIISIKKENGNFKIENIKYLPENFLCAPYHQWFYDAKALVEIVYNDNLKIVNKITNYETKDNIIKIEAIGKEKYLFEFIRLTNGYDILIKEYVYDNGWKETNLLPNDWKYLKLENNFN